MRNKLDILQSLIHRKCLLLLFPIRLTISGNLNAICAQYRDNGLELFTTRDDSQQRHRVTGWAGALPYDKYAEWRPVVRGQPQVDVMEAMRDLHHATERMLHEIIGKLARACPDYVSANQL